MQLLKNCTTLSNYRPLIPKAIGNGYNYFKETFWSIFEKNNNFSHIYDVKGCS